MLHVLCVDLKMMSCNNKHWACSWHDRELKFARTVIFTVEEINRDGKILPGVSLGYRLFNGCGNENQIRAAIDAINWEDSKGCTGQIQALIGHSSSGISKDINVILSALSIPQVKFFNFQSIFKFLLVYLNCCILKYVLDLM